MRYFGTFGTGKVYQIIDQHERSEQVVLPKFIKTLAKTPKKSQQTKIKKSNQSIKSK